MLRGDQQKINSKIILRKGKIYILKNKALRLEVIQLYHNVPVARHEEKQKTTELITRNYWWPEVTRDVKGCNLYQRMKNYIKSLVGKLIVNEVSKKLWTYLIVDLITKLLLVAGEDAILVVYKRLSKMTHFVVTIEKTSAKELARLFRDNM